MTSKSKLPLLNLPHSISLPSSKFSSAHFHLTRLCERLFILFLFFFCLSEYLILPLYTWSFLSPNVCFFLSLYTCFFLFPYKCFFLPFYIRFSLSPYHCLSIFPTLSLLLLQSSFVYMHLSFSL